MQGVLNLKLIITMPELNETAPATGDEGNCIAVLERGFVFQGAVTVREGWVLIGEAKNIRRWGTTKGLGELALSGPMKETKLDQCGNIKAPLAQLICLMPCKTTNW